MAKRYTVASARQNLAEVLDRAEHGEEVVIERRGVRFAVRAVSVEPAPARGRAPRLEILDPEVEAGTWSWRWSLTRGVEIAGGPRRRRGSRA